MKYIFPIIIIGACITVFVLAVSPRYKAMQQTRESVALSNANLQTAARLAQSREELITKYNAISKSDLDNLKTLLPDSVDNIRLIIQINALAAKNGLTILKNVNYEAKKDTPPTPQGTAAEVDKKGEFLISFQTTGQYKNFLSFLSDLEQNLRLVDVLNVTFSGVGETSQQTAANVLGYKVTLKTYWLKQ